MSGGGGGGGGERELAYCVCVHYHFLLFARSLLSALYCHGVLVPRNAGHIPFFSWTDCVQLAVSIKLVCSITKTEFWTSLYILVVKCLQQEPLHFGAVTQRFTMLLWSSDLRLTYHLVTGDLLPGHWWLTTWSLVTSLTTHSTIVLAVWALLHWSHGSPLDSPHTKL